MHLLCTNRRKLKKSREQIKKLTGFCSSIRSKQQMSNTNGIFQWTDAYNARVKINWNCFPVIHKYETTYENFEKYRYSIGDTKYIAKVKQRVPSWRTKISPSE